MLVIGAERDVKISLPRGLVSRFPATLFVQPEGLQLSYSKVMGIRYEWQWRSPVHQNEGLYSFELAFRFPAGRRSPSTGTVGRVNTPMKEYTRIKFGPWPDDAVTKDLAVSHQSKQGYQWTVESAPANWHIQDTFSLPVSSERQLVIRFSYDKDWAEGHPVWYQRRKVLSGRILDSVGLIGLD